MSGPTFYFFYQIEGKESKWNLDSAENRAAVIARHQPVFTTVLDLSAVPDDNEWSKVRYKGPFYADFDAEDDLPRVCEQFRLFLLKLNDSLDFDISQARLYATGSKGFHVEIDQEAFMAKVTPTGTAWLPYVYRAMSESLMVDTLDLNVYTGKKGRQWRTPNVRRDNGCYKVELTLEEAMGMTPELYLELIKEPRETIPRTPTHFNAKFGMAFERAKEKVVTQMRGKKKRQVAASVVLDPWKKAKKTPPTIEGLMNGTQVATGAGFQDLAMQLSIYAVSVDMPLDEFIDRCSGLCENHVSDSKRYGNPQRRREELTRMWNYMNESSLYDFDVGPLRKLVVRSNTMSDLGVIETEDTGDVPPPSTSAPASTDEDDGDAPAPAATDEADMHRGIRKGFYMNAGGMWKKNGDVVEPICRATLRAVESFYSVDKAEEFLGYEFDVVQPGQRKFRAMLGADAFGSAQKLKQFFIHHQIAFQGGDFEVMSLSDILAEKSKRSGRVYTYPREGFMMIQNPHSDTKDLVKVYLTQNEFMSSLKETDPKYFQLRYRPVQALSSYNIDIHKAPELGEDHREALHDLFAFTKDDVAADLIGWFVASMYRSVYLEAFNQFPLLQIWGEAGSGKSQTVWMLAHMHWYLKEISMKSATSCTPFAVDTHASTSTSAPFILDEFKPREMKMSGKGKYEKLKDMFKASYIGGDIGERGTLNKSAENGLAVIKNRATAPVVFMGEAIEMETAIIERSVTVNLTKSYQTRQRAAAFDRLHNDPVALSALGRQLLSAGFRLNVEGLKNEVLGIRRDIEDAMPSLDDENVKRAAARMIFNRAVIVHALRVLKHVLHEKFGDEFDEKVQALVDTRLTPVASADASIVAISAMSEVSKVMNRIAFMSRAQGERYELFRERDFIMGDGWVELRVEHAYDKYRSYCAEIRDTPLFDSVESFIYGLSAYSPVIDRNCASSELRLDGSTERIVRLSTKKLLKEGVQAFREF